MRKKRNVCVSMMLVLVLSVGLFAACGKKEGTTTDTKQEETQTQGTNTQNEKEENNSHNQETDTKQPDSQTSGKVSEEPAELSMWLVWSNSYVESPNDLVAVQKIEEETNVHINWTTVSTNEQSEKFGLMTASGDYPDLIYAAETYPGGVATGVDDGVFVDLTDLIPQYMPNYDAIRRSDESLYKDTITDDGRSVAVYVLASDDNGVKPEKVFAGKLIRKDWLDELGLDIPETMDDWHNMLQAFKEHYNCEAPFLMFRDGMDFITAYGIDSEFYQVDGTVKYGPLEPEYRTYLETMNQWFTEGLIDPNFMAGTVFWPTFADTATDRGGAGNGTWGETANSFVTRGTAIDPNCYVVGAPNPVLTAGDTPYIEYDADSRITKNTVAISSACQNQALALKWLDYWYTKDCMMLSTYGIEGETYVVNTDGSISMTDQIMNNPDGYTAMDALYFYTLGVADLGLYDWRAMDVMNDPDQVAAKDIWDAASRDHVIPSTITMTEEESTEYASKYTSILTLVQEMSLKYITGQESFDNYDNFVEDIKKYGIEDCIAIKQAALDRYNAR